MDVSFLEKAIEIVKRATEEDSKQNYEEAFKQYQNALDYFMAAIKCKEEDLPSVFHGHFI
jgi:vacuolar protein-sorting-associated protein 4